MNIIKVYKIDSTRIDTIRKRLYIRTLKILTLIFIVVLPMVYFQTDKKDLKYYGYSLFISVPAMVFGAYRGMNKLIKSYNTLEIILNDSGIEEKAEMRGYKKIDWRNLKIEEKSNGIINLCDATISTFDRKMYGKGQIVVMPEMIDHESMMKELRARAMGY